MVLNPTGVSDSKNLDFFLSISSHYLHSPFVFSYTNILPIFLYLQKERVEERRSYLPSFSFFFFYSKGILLCYLFCSVFVLSRSWVSYGCFIEKKKSHALCFCAWNFDYWFLFLSCHYCKPSVLL